jgi:hypothetical protein
MLHSLSSTHHSYAMPRFTKCLYYCTLKPHNEVLMTNPGLMIILALIYAFPFEKLTEKVRIT